MHKPTRARIALPLLLAACARGAGSTGADRGLSGRGARLDPTAAWSVVGEPYSALGMSLDGAGDVNGDGYADVIVGAPGYADWSGQARLYAGSAEGLSTTAVVLTGVLPYDSFGEVVVGAGDVDGDGYDDVLVTATGNFSGTGRTALYPGSAGGLATPSIVAFTEAGDPPYALAAAGDVNDDGYDDVIVGAFARGSAHLYLGSASGLVTPATTLVGGAGFGRSVAGAGDVNGDGYDDVVVGQRDFFRAGLAFVYLGSDAGLASSAHVQLSGDKSDTAFGTEVAGAGDINGDGYADLLVASPELNTSAPGRAFVYTGHTSGLATAATVLTGGSGAGFASALAGVGDVDADGYDDVVVGASYAQYAYVYHGSPNGLSDTTALPGSDAYFGDTLTGAGDVDGDGADDVLVGAWAAAGKFGSAHLFAGAVLDADDDGVPASADCDDGDPAVTVDPVTPRFRDADGDGYGDPATSAVVCTQVAGYVADGGDCDDTDPAVNEGTKGFRDADGDGRGDVEAAAQVCSATEGYVATSDDCDDTDPDVGGPITQYIDTDLDGYGAGSTVPACPGLVGYAATDTDCDDKDPSVGEAADEWFLDDDRDSYGAPGETFMLCPSTGGYTPGGAGYSLTNDDCDDRNSYVGPPDVQQFADADGDGYGDPDAGAFACASLEGYVGDSTDCDDTSAATHPGVEDVGEDGIDQNCSGADAQLLGCGCSTSARSGMPALLALLCGALGLGRRPTRGAPR